ncbi:MAG TPA: hypothetical protein VFZ96_10665, partial [Actinomycetota bacterium]|nr:hypothetical protein [Actinomycetota bacterium]
MSSRAPRRWWPWVAVAAVAGLILAGVGIVATADRDRSERTIPSPAATSATPPSPTPVTPEPLAVELGRVVGRRVEGRLSRPTLRTAARSVRDVMGQFYTAAFIDPVRSGEVAVPPLVESFARDARAAARQDLGALTLGGAAGRLDEVGRVEASLDVRVVGD